MEIKKVLLRTDGIKYIVIPKDSNIKEGDYVKITKIEEDKNVRRRKTKQKRS